MTSRRVPLPLIAAVVGVVASVGIVAAGVLSPLATQVVDDAAQFLAGLCATATSWWTARRHTAGQRAWRLRIGIGTAGWTVGQGIWSWYQLFADRPLPSPSWADAGYLTLPAFALLGLVALAGGGLGEGGRAHPESGAAAPATLK